MVLKRILKHKAILAALFFFAVWFIHIAANVIVATEDAVARGFTKTVAVGKDIMVKEVSATLNLEPVKPQEEELPLSLFLDMTAIESGVHPALVRAVMHVESTNKPMAYSPKGAIGLMQVMPFNAARCSLKSPTELWDEKKNIRCGIQILKEELAKNRLDNALRVYNAGYKGIHGNFKETEKYVVDVLDRFSSELNQLATVDRTSSPS